MKVVSIVELPMQVLREELSYGVLPDPETPIRITTRA